MVYWLVAVVIVVLGLLIIASMRKRKVVDSTDLKTHKPCSYCNEEIAIDAEVCKYCRGVVVSSN
ncbi:hypothetical protein BC351_39365 [Paenibacillus ferrarius]|uniref:Uncharacterized protein n=1 Tax=Paenibacillus ferrarius TaxID=1469647 RepID=A0A1V4H9B9_9BACL|nr:MULTISPECIES: hypothetical protein [Paenibacillus]NQX71307.1 hypothetical protein [Paenibacillus alba]OPH47880.1 hypothetical protein BC351_39365 [Paenibacillus ferrarius]